MNCHGRSTIFSVAVCVLRSIVYLRISFESPARACMVFVWILCFSSVCVFACWFDVFCAPVYLHLSLRTLRRRSVAFSPVCRSVQRFCRVVRSYTANSRRAGAGAGNCEWEWMVAADRVGSREMPSRECWSKTSVTFR